MKTTQRIKRKQPPHDGDDNAAKRVKVQKPVPVVEGWTYDADFWKRYQWKLNGSTTAPHVIGKGSFSKVYLMRDTTTNSLRAVKIMRAKLSHVSASALREIHMMQYLSAMPSCSPHVVGYDTHRIVDNIDVIQGKKERQSLSKPMHKFVVVMEYITGSTLEELLELYRKAKKPITSSLIISFTHHLLKALCYLHQRNVAHRDIKISNIMVNTLGGEIVTTFKWIDMGFSCTKHSAVRAKKYKLLKKLNASATCNQRFGTVLYMSPTMFLNYNNNVLDVASWKQNDVWAAGMVLFEFITGKHYLPEFLITDTRLKSDDNAVMMTEDRTLRALFHYLLDNRTPVTAAWHPIVSQYQAPLLLDIKNNYPQSIYRLFLSMTHVNPAKRITAEMALYNFERDLYSWRV